MKKVIELIICNIKGRNKIAATKNIVDIAATRQQLKRYRSCLEKDRPAS